MKERARVGTVTLGLSGAERGLARALDGDADSLKQLLQEDAGGELARRHRAGPALYLQARRRGLDGPALAAWLRDLRSAAATHLVLGAALEETAAALDEAGIPWVPLKGCDLALRVYGEVEERPASDLDLLVHPREMAAARRVLEEAGFQGLDTGPRSDAYLREEGYAWQATSPSGALVELHYRLWGLVPEGFAAAIFERAADDAELPAGGRRLRLADAYVVAAVHVWLDPPPRGLVGFQDLAKTSDALSAAAGVVAAARDGDLQLPVALAARVSAELWGRPVCEAVARELGAELRWPERVLAERAARRGLARVPLAGIAAARLAAARRSRHRLGRSVWRRLWPHPGIVERATPGEWSWPRRRLWVVAAALRRRS